MIKLTLVIFFPLIIVEQEFVYVNKTSNANEAKRDSFQLNKCTQ